MESNSVSDAVYVERSDCAEDPGATPCKQDSEDLGDAGVQQSGSGSTCCGVFSPVTAVAVDAAASCEEARLREEEAAEENSCGEQRAQELEAELEKRETELRQPVGMLLQKMNSSSENVNALEIQCSEAQSRYGVLLEGWRRLYEDQRALYGQSLDQARPYWDQLQVLKAASLRVKCVVREFSQAASDLAQAKGELRAIEERLAYGAHQIVLDGEQQEGLARATVRVLRIQQARDRLEQEYAKALQEYTLAQELADQRRVQVGETVVRRAHPCFKQLQRHQSQLTAEQNRINTKGEQLRQAKILYRDSMRELDQISVAIHELRKATKAEQALLAKKSSTPLPPELEDMDEAGGTVTTSPSGHKTSGGRKIAFQSQSQERETKAEAIANSTCDREAHDSPFA